MLDIFPALIGAFGEGRGGGGALFGSQFQITVHHFKETRVARNWKQVFTEHPQSRAGSTDLEA